MSIFLIVRTRPVAILEVDAEILHSLSFQFFEHAFIDRLREVFRKLDRSCKYLRVRCICFKSPDPQRPKPLGGIRFKKVSSAVDGMDRLPASGFTGIAI